MLERRVNLVCLDCQDTQDDKGLRDQLASLVWQESQERKDEGVQQVSQGLEAKEVLMEPEGKEEQGGPLESLEKRVLLDKMVLQDPLESRVPKGHREDMVNQDLEGLMVHLEKMDYQVIQAREGNQASKARMDSPAPQVLLDRRANLVRQGQLEIEAIQVPLDHRGSMVYRELLERRVPRETQVHQDPQGRVVLLGFKGSEGAEGPPVQWVLQV